MAFVPGSLRDLIDAHWATNNTVYAAAEKRPDIKAGLLEAIDQAFAEILPTLTVTVTVASVSGVTTGPGVSGAGAGTGVIS